MCKYIYIFIYIYTHTHTHTYIRIRTYIQESILFSVSDDKKMFIRIHTYTYTHKYTYTHACRRACFSQWATTKRCSSGTCARLKRLLARMSFQIGPLILSIATPTENTF